MIPSYTLVIVIHGYFVSHLALSIRKLRFFDSEFVSFE